MILIPLLSLDRSVREGSLVLGRSMGLTMDVVMKTSSVHFSFLSFYSSMQRVGTYFPFSCRVSICV
jgi:hypothetical protein